jgi:hypothetical protein
MNIRNPQNWVHTYTTPVFPGAENNGIGPLTEGWIGGLCHQAWRVFDSLMTLEAISSLDACVEAGVKLGLNEGNLRTEYSRWRRFNGFPSLREERAAA